MKLYKFEKLPKTLYHGSSFLETDYLLPGFYHSKKLIRWDETESNLYLYATTDKEEAVMLGFASAIEKKFKLNHFKRTETEIIIETPSKISVKDLDDLDVYVYKITPKEKDTWVKNKNERNGLDSEWKTVRKIKFSDQEKVAVGSWLKSLKQKISIIVKEEK